MLNTTEIKKRAEAEIKSAINYDVIDMSFYVDAQEEILEILDALEEARSELERTRQAALELREWIKTLAPYLKMDNPEKPLILSDITEVVQETKWLEDLG